MGGVVIFTQKGDFPLDRSILPDFHRFPHKPFARKSAVLAENSAVLAERPAVLAEKTAKASAKMRTNLCDFHNHYDSPEF